MADNKPIQALETMLKVLLISFAVCFAQVALAEEGLVRNFKNFQARPLHKPEQQQNPMVIPIYVPAQQYPVQQYPQVQHYPVQQYPVQYIPVQQHYPQYPQHHHYPQYPQMQFYPGIPC